MTSGLLAYLKGPYATMYSLVVKVHAFHGYSFCVFAVDFCLHQILTSTSVLTGSSLVLWLICLVPVVWLLAPCYVNPLSSHRLQKQTHTKAKLYENIYMCFCGYNTFEKGFPALFWRDPVLFLAPSCITTVWSAIEEKWVQSWYFIQISSSQEDVYSFFCRTVEVVCSFSSDFQPILLRPRLVPPIVKTSRV